MQRRTIVSLALVAGVGTVMAGPATAGPKKPPIKKTVDYTDATPDPTGNANSGGNASHCSGMLPSGETGIAFAAPAAGSLKATLGGFQGDWSLQMRDGKGKVLGGDDVNPPGYESATIKIKAKGKYVIFPCNLGGTPLATVTYVFTYK